MVEATDETQEIKKNLKIIWNFCRKHYFIFILLILIILNIHLRMIPFYLPVTDDWARNTMDNLISANIREELKNKYSKDLPEEFFEKTFEEEKQKFYLENEADIKQQIIGLSNEFKKRLRRDNDMTYLIALDPYFWYKRAANIAENGHPGNFIAEEDIQSYRLIKKGSSVDSFSLAPFGRSVGSMNFYPYFIYVWSLLFKPFGIDMMGAEFFIPIFWVTLAIFPVFFIVRRIAGNMGGFIAALIMITNKPFLSRAIGGFADTDCFQVVMPLFIVWFLLEAYHAKKLSYKYLLSTLSAFTTMLFAYTWVGWSYIYNVIIIFFVLYAIVLFLTKKSIENHIKIGASFLIVSSILLTLVRGPYTMLLMLIEPLTTFMKLKEVGILKIWPNVLTTVAEQNEISFLRTFDVVGHKLLFLFIFVGLIYMIKNKNWKYLIIFSIWFIATFYAITMGARYVQLNLPAFAILIGIGVGYLFLTLITQTEKRLKIKKRWPYIILIIIMLVLIYPLISSAYAMAKQEIPMMNDAWWNGLQKIDEEAPENSIINSWWDMGHWFKAVGNRPTTFDGASQDTPPAHWIGKVLLTSNETEAVAILKMLDCGGNRAYAVIQEETKDELLAVETISKALLLEKEKARELLQSIVSKETANNVIDKYMFCENPPTNYFITSEDMIQKSGVWAHFGSWNFRRAKMYQDYKKEKDKQYFIDYYNLTKEEVNNLFRELQRLKPNEVNNWIAPWPSYFTGYDSCSKEKDMIICNRNIEGQLFFVEVNLTTMTSSILYENEKVDFNFYSVVLFIDDDVVEIINEGEKIMPITMSILPTGRNIISSPEIGMSMFNRLLNFEGLGLKHFEPFYKERSFINDRIYIWEVKWEIQDI